MAKQVYTTGQILTASQMTTLQANDYNQTVSAKTASYTLVAADAGTRITMSNASATTITVNTAIFAAGDTLEITNIGAGICTVTAGTATVSTSSTLALKQFDTGQLYFTSTGVAIFFMADAADAGGSPLTTKGDLYTFSTVDARLAVGTNGQVLTADSSEATGLKYATPAAGAMTLIQRSSFSNVANTGTTFDSLFTSSFTSYEVVIESIFAGTFADDLILLWRYAGPTSQITSYFGNTINVESGNTTITNTNQSNQPQAIISTFTGSTADRSTATLNITGASGASSYVNFYSILNVGGGGSTQTTSMTQLAARIYTGFQLKSSSSNITGTISIYGLRNT